MNNSVVSSKLHCVVKIWLLQFWMNVLPPSSQFNTTIPYHMRFCFKQVLKGVKWLRKSGWGNKISDVTYFVNTCHITPTCPLNMRKRRKLCYTWCKYPDKAHNIFLPALLSLTIFRHVNINPVFGGWQHVKVGCVADISDKHAASIFRVEECMMKRLFIYRQVWSSKTHRRQGS
jgi:hypothetical protein